MFKLTRFFKPYKLQFIIGPLFKFLEAVYELILPLIMANIIDVGIANKDNGYVVKGCLFMILLGVVGWVFAIIAQKSAAIASQGSGTGIRNALYRHINTLSYQDIDKLGASLLVTRITNDVNQVQLAVAMLIRLVVRSPFLVIGALVMSVAISPKISIIFFVAAVLIALILYLIMSKSVPFFHAIQKFLDKLSLLSQETLLGSRVIRVFGKQKYHIKRFNTTNEDLAKTAVRVGRLSALLNPLTFVVANFGMIFIVWIGADFVFKGEMKTGEIIALVNYMNQILLSMIIVANLVVIFTKATACAGRINEIFEYEPSLKEKPNTNENDKIKQKTINTGKKHKGEHNSPKIEFDKVTFGYNKDKHVLKNISFSVMDGQTVGIIGTTGSGKTSLINLIPRFYNADHGKIKIDGVCVKNYTFKELRKKVALVPQQTSLLSGTIKYNLTLGNKNASKEEIDNALNIAQAKEFVEKLPLKEKSYITKGGKNLSGGQKQRLAIARAVITRSDILILDDSSSALDFSTDLALRKSLAEENKKSEKKRTVIIVSQRISSVKSCEKIIVLKNGEVQCINDHKTLLKECTEYKEIYDSQNQDNAEEPVKAGV